MQWVVAGRACVRILELGEIYGDYNHQELMDSTCRKQGGATTLPSRSFTQLERNLTASSTLSMAFNLVMQIYALCIEMQTWSIAIGSLAVAESSTTCWCGVSAA